LAHNALAHSVRSPPPCGYRCLLSWGWLAIPPDAYVIDIKKISLAGKCSKLPLIASSVLPI
jgi:hypothetical protein